MLLIVEGDLFFLNQTHFEDQTLGWIEAPCMVPQARTLEPTNVEKTLHFQSALSSAALDLHQRSEPSDNAPLSGGTLPS